MKTKALMTCLLAVMALRAPAAGDVVINEIMYHPFHALAQAENTGQEWVELHNRGSNAVVMDGWRLAKGVEFTFTNVTMQPGEYLVVAASRTTFLARYPGVTNVLGNWTGRLGNTEDEIALLDALGEEVARVHYADSGDWAVRARAPADAYGLRGWDWLAPHDGGGFTLELINPSMPIGYGQNWTTSLASNGTPGVANGALTNNTAPFIQNVSHFPLVPRSTESVVMKARLEDELAAGLAVTLFWRAANSVSPPAFGSLTMFDDGAHGDGLAGDGTFAATIPAQANNTIVEFYITAADGGGLTRQWPAPSRNAPDLGGAVLPPDSGANALYAVDDATYAGTQPLYRMIMTESERAFLASIAGSLRNSDASAHGTFVSVDANGSAEHHTASFRRRGAGSRGATVPNYRVNFASDKRWKGVTAVNLNSQYTHAQVAGAALAAVSGLQAEFQKPVQLRLNNLTNASPNSPQFGSYAHQEVPDGDYANRHFPDDPNGNIYRASSGSHTATLAYLGTDPNSYISAGYSKTSNGAENDWADLINLTDVLANTPDATYVNAMRARVNVEQWMIYFAVFTLLDSKETSLGIGVGDDYGMYRGLIDTRFQLLGHDFDTVLGQGDTAGNVNDSIWRATSVPAIDRFLRRAEFAPVYYRALTNLMMTAFASNSVSAVLDQHLGSWVPGGVLANMKNFSVNRNAGVLAQIPLRLSISNSLATLNGYPRSTVATVSLYGNAHAVATRSILVNGVPATWSAWDARWFANVTLLPGINRVTVVAFDEAGREIERGSTDLWYDTGGGTAIGGDIFSDLTLLAASGPYTVASNMVVHDEATLTIQAGTTVYVAPGATITVNLAGRILAQGTETQHIRIGKNPNVAGNWGSLALGGTSVESRFSYVDFDSCGGTTISGHNAQVHVNDSIAFFDHCTWPASPAVQYISFDASSFIVQGCVFPTYPSATSAPEMLHGVNGIPAGGYGIFRDNYFGHTWGFNDTIDFTGGQRPGAILQVIGNVFDGASDDHLDLDSTDAWIEGNVFLHAHRDPNRTDNPLDTSSAISGGVDVLGRNPDWTIINNLFYDVDHAFLNKGNSTSVGNGGGRVAFLHNTVVHVARENSGSPAAEIAVFAWSDNGIVPPDPAIGSGLYAAHNIIHDAPALHRLYSPSNHFVVMENNILPASFQGTTNEWTGPGTNNRYLDPRLNLAALAGVAVSNVTPAQAREAFRLLSGSPALGAGFGSRDIGGFSPAGIAIHGAPEGTNTAATAQFSVGPGGTFDWGTNTAQPWGWTAFKWKLDDGPWSAVIPLTNLPPFTNPPVITLSNLAPGAHTIYAVGQNDAGWFQDDTFVYPSNSTVAARVTTSRTWFVDTNLSRLVINEVLARNVAAVPVGGKYPDLVELRNAGAKSVDISDLSLTDDLTQPRKFIFPAGTSIPAGGHLTLVAAGGEAPGQIYLGFSLNDAGEGVFLFDRLAGGGALVDSVTFGIQLPDLSIGRMADGQWTLTTPTFGAANLAQPLGEKARLKINEWLAAAGTVFPEDFIEVFNADTRPVALGGLALSGSPMSAPRMSVIPPLSFIAAGGWQPFTADGNTAAGADHVNFKLSAEGGWISLADTNGVFIDVLAYGTQVPDVSTGRSPDGSNGYIAFNQPTPGAGNPGQTVVITPVTTTLVPLTQTWRMEASAVDLGTAWRANNYNDAAWFSGPALFYNYDGGGGQVPPVPVGSVIPFTSPKQTTVYFRTAFNFAGSTNGMTFQLSHVIDDGCVVYLNNVEVFRYNMPAGVVSYSTRPPTVISGAPAVSTGNAVFLPNLVNGTNYLAVEVHQQSANSSDIAMAVGIEGFRFTTNYLSVPVVLNEAFTKNTSYTNAAGRAVDWVELFNPSTNTVDISDLSLSDDLLNPRRWTFPQGASIAPGGYYVVEFDDSAPYTPFNAGFELSADSGAIYLFHRGSAGGALLDSVVYGVQVADLSLGRATPGANASWTLCVPTRGAANVTVPLGSPNALVVNEWMPNDSGGRDDWFEVFNPGAQPVALGGLHLTDNLANTIKHKIRALSFIGTGPEAFVQFIADNDTDRGADHVNFKLSSTNGAVGLYTSNAVPSLVSAIIYTTSQNGVSQGRLPDGTTNIVSFTNSASPEAANWLPLLHSVVINEALTRPVPPLEQAIEIHNPTEVDVAIGGWFLSNARKDLKRFQIPAGTILPAGGFKVFYECQFNTNNDVPPSFALNGDDADEIILSVADANGVLSGFRLMVDFGASAEGVSFGRHEKSTGEDFVAMSARSLGPVSPETVAEFRAGPGATNPYPLVGPVIISEIHYHPPDIGTNDNPGDEYIELRNLSMVPVPLFDVAFPTNTWRLRNAVDFDFPTNTALSPTGYLVVVSFDPTNTAMLTAFRAKFGLGTNVPVIGPWSGKLDNGGEAVELQRPDAPAGSRVPHILVERVNYSDDPPWPTAVDGNTNGLGMALHRRVTTNYANDAVNWLAAQPTPGLPPIGIVNLPPFVTLHPADRAVAAGSNVTFLVSAVGTTPFTFQWRIDGIAIAGATNNTFTASNAQPAKAGRYSVLVMNAWGSALGGPALLSVQAPPQIVQQPQDRAAVEGTDTTFTVTASGGSLAYQWRFYGTNLPGASAATFTLAGVSPARGGPYSVVVSNALGAVTSVVATLTVVSPPVITTQPQSIAIVVGSSAGFTVAATGTAPLRYQWRLNGTNIAGATNASLTIAGAQPADAGDYTVVVSNTVGVATSAVATLTVIVPPTVTVTASDVFASEPGANTGRFTFARTGDTSAVLVVHYAISGTATPGGDYAALAGTATIPAGSTNLDVVVTPLDDPTPEGDETVTVTITNNAAYLIGAPPAATVIIQDEDNAPPVITITAPTNGQMFVRTPTNVNITVSVNDPDGTIARVEFFADGVLLGEVTNAPFNFTWTNAPAGTNALTARATDNLGSTAISTPVQVILNAQPAIAIVSPVNGTTFTPGSDIAISTFASDADGAVTQVLFVVNGSVAGTDTAAPFALTLTNPPVANYVMRAVAWDDRGAVATSAVVNVTVNQPGIFDDFEPDIDLAQWSAFGGVLYTDLAATNHGGSVSPTHGLWFGGDLTRSAATRPVNALLGGTISFQLRIAGGGGSLFEQADLSGEGVVLEYTVNNGGNWAAVATFDTPGAPYTQGWSAQQFAVPAGAQSTNTIFRWRQLSHSGSCCDHWAIDDVQVLIGPTPPNISMQPSDQYAIAGGSATFAVTVYGSAPFTYQWRFNGTNLPGATNATLALNTVNTNQGGAYSVAITNDYGFAISASATLTIVEGGNEYFRITALTAGNAAIVEHGGVTGDDRGGIALSSSQVFVTGDNATARFSASSLAGGTSLGAIYDGLVADLRTETVYSFSTNGTTPVVNYSGDIRFSHLLELNANTGLPTGYSIPLTPAINANNYGNYGFFSGYGRVVFHNGQRAYHISLPSGAVTDLGAMAAPSHQWSESWGYWGVAELDTNGVSLVYVQNSATIARARVPSGAISTVATFSSLSDMASFTVSVPRGRWYFHHESGSQFGGSDETVGYADAQFSLSPGTGVAPMIVIAPQQAVALQGAPASFAVAAVGSPTLAYQWYFNGTEIPGAIAPTFAIPDVQPAVLGNYAVVITNEFGAVTSAPVALIIGLPPVITGQPQSQTVLSGASVAFTVEHTGDGPFTYQWRFNGFNWTQTTTNTLAVSFVNYYYNGLISVEVRNAVGSATSSNAALVVLSPPFFNATMTDRSVLRGMDATLSAVVDGSLPWFAQWFRDGSPVPDATNTVFAIANAQTADAGLYQLVVTNAYGAITGTVNLTVMELDGESFAIKSLGTNDLFTNNIYPVVGYIYQNGIAASSGRLFVNGYGTSGAGLAGTFSPTDLSGGTALGTNRSGLVGDLKTRKVYSLANSNGLIGVNGGLVTALVELDGTNGAITTNVITLTTNISMTSYSAVFAGYGRIVLMDSSSRVYDIALPSGETRYLGFQSSYSYEYAYGYAYRGWGVAEKIGTNIWLVHERDYQSIVRTRVPDGMTEVIAGFASLGSYGNNMTVSVPRNRWYFHHYGSSQFMPHSENNLVSGSASFIYLGPSNAAPAIIDQPVSRTVPVNGTANFSAAVDGSHPLGFQWFFKGGPLPGQTNALLTLPGVRATNEGPYFVVVSNAFGMATSAVVTLTVNFGSFGSTTMPLLGLTNTIWRYNQTAVFNNTSFAATNFSDSAWPTGRALLAVETAASVTPYIGTVLTIGRTSYYFRVSFNVPSNFPSGTTLQAKTWIDDGAIIYLNGRIVQRVRMTSGSYNHFTFATGTPPNNSDAAEEVFTWAGTNVVAGTNVLAAEVHQNTAGSSDIVWGMSLDAIIPLSARPPTITNHPVSRVATNGTNVSFTVGASGTGPLRYQWLHQGTNVPGATATTLNLTNIQRRHAGIYTVRVTNNYDTVYSSNATLTVLVPPVQVLGGSLTFSAPGTFTLQFTGDSGAVFAIETSTNLQNWTQSGAITNLTGSALFQDATATNDTHRFYRLRLVQ
jgi:hypothetical protein